MLNLQKADSGTLRLSRVHYHYKKYKKERVRKSLTNTMADQRSHTRNCVAAAAGECFLLQGQLSVLTHFGIRSTPALLQQHVNDHGHSAKRAGSRLQLNTHAPYLCGFE